MTQEEAKKVFLEYGGLDFHFIRENPQLYQEFKEMDISDETKELWRQELIEKLFDRFYDSDQPKWSVLQSLISLLHETKSNQSVNCAKLLKALKDMAICSEDEVELITKLLAGGTFDYSDGAVKFICDHSSLIREFETTVCKINNIPSIEAALKNDQFPIDERRRYALDSFRKAVEKYSKKKEANKNRCSSEKLKRAKRFFRRI